MSPFSLATAAGDSDGSVFDVVDGLTDQAIGLAGVIAILIGIILIIKSIFDNGPTWGNLLSAVALVGVFLFFVFNVDDLQGWFDSLFEEAGEVGQNVPAEDGDLNPRN